MKGTRTIGMLVLTALASIGGVPRAAAQDDAVVLSGQQAGYQGENSAWWRYEIFAQVADAEGLPEYATFFRALKHAEGIHRARFERHVRDLNADPDPYVRGFKVGTTEQNLETAILGEHEEWTTLYPYLKTTLDPTCHPEPHRSLSYAGSAEASHERACDRALLGLLESNPGPHPLPLFVCSGCGCVCFEKTGKSCPVCNCSSEDAVAFR